MSMPSAPNRLVPGSWPRVKVPGLVHCIFVGDQYRLHFVGFVQGNFFVGGVSNQELYFSSPSVPGLHQVALCKMASGELRFALA